MIINIKNIVAFSELFGTFMYASVAMCQSDNQDVLSKLRNATVTEQQQHTEHLQKQRQQIFGGISSGGSLDFVMVHASCIAFFACGLDKFTLSGGTGNFSNGGSTVSILKGYNGSLGGQYNYTLRINYRKYCSGSFHVSGSKANVLLNIYEDCSAEVSEH